MGCHLLLQGFLLNPGIKLGSLELAGGFFINEPPEKPESSIFVENLVHNREGISFKEGYLINGIGTTL